MMNINQVTLVGRLATDISFYPAKGKTAARATGILVVNRTPGKNADPGNDAIPIIAWGKNAEILAKYTGTGKELGITGAVRVSFIAKVSERSKGYSRVEILVQTISLGADSSKTKIQKAMAGTASELKSALKTLGLDPETPLEELISNPAVRSLVANTKPTSKPPSVDVPKESISKPFIG